ncbi:T9SS type A sorting domain-containing protein [Rurimicrobium arvi]|uniref:Secretion system C-terminal sorting domain-containing protein n=1 Tax=Rurimicrobium arvi TaxID=2049916 RepID=A0ABP8N1S3_9BACT
MPTVSRPDLFTFYEDNNVNMPAGADRVSKSVIYVQGVAPHLPNGYDGAGTAFIIRTFRDDDFVCVCMTGHQIQDLTGLTPNVPSDIDFRTLITMNYKASDHVNPSDGETYVGLHEGSSSYLSEAQLVALFGDPPSAGTGNDAALLLINKRKLPSGSFVALGYDFGVINASTYQSYFSVSHPWGYPQRLSKNLAYYNDANNWIEFDVQKPYAMASGSSGSPLINATTTSVQGITAYSKRMATFNAPTVYGPTVPFSYALRLGITRISLLESAIKEHCWKNANKEQILSSGIYKQSVEVSNPKLDLLRNTNLSISFSADIPGSSAAFTEDALNGKKVTQLTANNCTFGSFALPVAYPGTTATPWRVVVSANQVDVNAGFSYTASGASELDLTTIETYTRSATSRLADAADTASNSSVAGSAAAPGFKLYPNPSPDGVFFLELPSGEKDIVYTGSVMSVDGKLLQQQDHMQGGTKASFNLSQQPHGMYLLNVHDPEGRLVFTTKITWQ